jgi:ABC-type multidrug transport system permease subunit
MPNTTAWIFSRNSLLFFMIIAQANGIVISAVSVFQRERTLLHRERAKKMYRVSSYFLAKTTSDMTNNVLLPCLYGLVVYWTAGFRPTFAAYVKFFLAFYLTLSTAQSMGLWLSIAISSTQLSLVLAPPITLFFMILGGFYIPFQNMRPVVEWASWLSFARYGYSALIINEYEGTLIPCADPSDISFSVGGGSGECPYPGEEVISSLGITGVADSYWFNIGMIALLQVAFRVVAYVCLRRIKQ